VNNAAANIRILQELIEAIARRVPQVERAGEAAIAREAAALKTRALERIAELEREAGQPRDAVD
jgi:hypothetical protein